MAVNGAHFDLAPGAQDAMVLHWVYDPRRVTQMRQGLNAGPSIEDSSVVAVNVGVDFLGPFPALGLPLIDDFFATIEWSSGGKDVQRVEFDCLKGSGLSIAAARAAVYLSYVLSPGIDPALMPTARVNVTLGRLPSGREKPRRTRLLGTVNNGAGSAQVQIPSFAESLVVLSDQVPLVVNVAQLQDNLTSSQQNVTASTQVVPVDALADSIVLNNNGAVPARLAAQFNLAL